MSAWQEKQVWIERVMATPHLSNGAKLLAWEILNRAYGDKMWSKPGVTVIASDLGLSSTGRLNEWKKELEAAGAIKIEIGRTSGNKKYSIFHIVGSYGLGTIVPDKHLTSSTMVPEPSTYVPDTEHHGAQTEHIGATNTLMSSSETQRDTKAVASGEPLGDTKKIVDRFEKDWMQSGPGSLSPLVEEFGLDRVAEYVEDRRLDLEQDSDRPDGYRFPDRFLRQARRALGA